MSSTDPLTQARIQSVAIVMEPYFQTSVYLLFLQVQGNCL